MRFLPLCVCAALFAMPAKADKFWLSDPAAPQNAAGSPEIIEGVLLAENDEGYHLRVVGGELLLPKKSVFKVEKDGLSIEAITKAEQAVATRLADQNRERQLAQQADSKAREIRAVEAAVRRQAQPVDARAPAEAGGFDPVIGVSRAPAVVQADLMTDAQLAYEMTRDRRYLRVLRQLRRLR
jgi:hypothetical protein